MHSVWFLLGAIFKSFINFSMSGMFYLVEAVDIFLGFEIESALLFWIEMGDCL